MTVNAPGDYIATITDTTGCKTVSDTVHVSLDSFSLVQLVAPDTLICGNSAVTLNDTAFHPVSYFWSPGGDTSALFRIDTNGLYSVTVTDINGCEAHGSVQVTTHGASPTANFGVSSLCLGTNTMFTDQSQPVLPDAIDSFYWQLSGGTPSFATVANPITTYHAFGNYSVTVHLVTDSGCTAAVTKVITIYPRPNTSFNYQGSNSSQELASIICAGTYVNFTDTSIAVGGAALTSRLWEFNGIPDSNTDAHILYDFPVEGDYTATLIVTNADGCSDTLTQPIEVFPALTANFADSGTCGADTTRFIDLTNSFSVVSWLWTFGDGTTSANENPVHYYGGSGANLVTLTVENAIGCISTISKNVSVFQNPVAGFSATTGCENHYYTPEDNTLTFGDPVVSWNWTIAGSRFISQAPEYLFTDTGNYPVTLAVTTQNGCYDSTAQNITIKTNPVAEFAYTPLYGSAPVNVNFINLSTGAEHYIWNFGDSSYSTEENPEHTFTEDTIFNVVLVAINTYGCADTITRQYITQPTNLCLEVTGVASIQTPQADGTVLVQVVVQLVNFGTRIVTSAEIKATLGSGGVLVQEWTGNLITGQIILDTIPAQFDVSPASANTYVCVSVSNVNNGQIETNCSSNEYCSSLTGTMQLAGPSPNPAANQSILGIILPQAGQVYIAVYDAMGNPVMNEQVFNMPAGITDFPLPVQQWGAGTYFIRVRYNYDTEVRKIIVL
jgi:PKD repeat protein